MMFFDDPAVRDVTFASPDTGKGYLRRALDASIAAADTGIGPGFDPALAPASILPALKKEAAGLADVVTGKGNFGRLASAAWDQTNFVDTEVSRTVTQEESFDRIIRAVKDASGVTLENPSRGGYDAVARARSKEEQAGTDPFFRRRDREHLFGYAAEEFSRKANELAQSDPKIFDALNVARIDQSPDMIQRRASAQFEAEAADMPSMIATLGASLTGGIIPSLRSPSNAAGLLAGGGASTAATIARRLAVVAWRESGINAGITALQQPFVQETRRDAGLSSGLSEAASNIAMAAAIGGVIGGGVQGGRELSSARAVSKALRDSGVKLEPEEASALRGAVASEKADAAVMATRPKDMPADVADDVLQQAIRHAEDPVNNPPAEIPVLLPKLRADRQQVIDEALPGKPGDVATVDGKPVSFARFDPSEIGTDAGAMQYKGNGDAAGVTDRLQSVTQWDPLAGGRVFVYERLDGSQVIADGHQRLGLARRLQAEGQSGPVELIGHRFREADGWTPADVRALAAKKNMQEGSGSALDAARILRDRPDLADGALPTSGPVIRQGLQLARLSDEAFGLVNAGVVPEWMGARVGALVANPVEHAAVMGDLVRYRPETIRETDMFIGESLRAGFVDVTQIDMFGALESRASLMAERVKVLNEAVKLVASDKRLFGLLDVNAGRIENAGNVLAKEKNADRAASAAGLAELMAKLATRAGPVSDELTLAARALKEGGKPGQAARSFADAVSTIIERDGLPALLADPVLKAPHAAEPGTVQALAQATPVEPRDPFTADMFAAPKADAVKPEPVKASLPDAPPADLIDQVALPSRDDPAGTRLVSRADALAEAEQTGFHADLIQACKQ